MEASLRQPVFDPIRPWHERLQAAGGATLGHLNALADAAGLRTESGRPVRFVPPGAADAYYEVRVFESGCVETRPESLHDLFNALAWLAFPRTKARINAMHAERIPHERGRRGRLRDLLTLFDEGGAIVACADAELLALLRGFRWKELFWEHRRRVLRSMRISVLGHAVLEKALEPWPGITCKAIFVAPGADADAQAAAWLAQRSTQATRGGSPEASGRSSTTTRAISGAPGAILRAPMETPDSATPARRPPPRGGAKGPPRGSARCGRRARRP